jgi:L,D-transpeptidase-like protein
MANAIDRRGFIASAAAATGALVLPARLPAQAATLDARSARILDIARTQMQRMARVLWRTDIVGLADFGAHSSQPRFHFANLEAGTVKSYLVAHGAGSDPERDGWLHWFSNEPGSNATSRGAYISYQWYTGKYGTSIRLGGLEAENSNVLDRAIVLHSAPYATPAFVAEHGMLGRSNGCFAMNPADFPYALTQLSGGRLIYADKLGVA